MGDPSVTSLYRKVVSPSIKFHTEGLQKENHARHKSRFGGASPTRVPTPSFLVTRPTRNANSAPIRTEDRSIILRSPAGRQSPANERTESDTKNEFYPTTRFKRTSLPAMPMTSRYGTQSVNGTSKTVPLTASRHSALSLPDKIHTTADINPRIMFTSQRERQLEECRAKAECRRLKRKSEIIAHRVDTHYYLCGSKLPVKNRWQVDANDLLRLKLLSHQKQLGQYQAIKDSQSDTSNPRDSPSGQLSSPTPASLKESGLSGQESLYESEGKWAEDTKSETSSIDDMEQLLALQARRIKQRKSPTDNRQPTDTTEDSTRTQTIETDENQNKENEQLKDNDIQTSVDDQKVNDEEERLAGGNSEMEDKQNEKKIISTTEKPKTANKKIKNLRFQDDVIKKPVNQRKAKSGQSKKEDKKNEVENKDEKKDDHVNPYMDEWLGRKKKEVDGRYKPGKPPPNRIFISSEISKSKVAQAVKFSEMFLTETITLHENHMNSEYLTPETMYGIVGEKQKEALKEMFNEVDKDKNGSVTLDELKMKMMPGVSKDDIKNFVQVFDLNKDKTVDCREFTAICCLNDRLAGTRTETADGSIALELEKLAQHIVIFKEMYKTMDEDDDNRLDCNEVLVMVSAAMETEMGGDLTDARRVLSAARDEFGYIDFVGFLSYIPFFAKLLQAIMKNPLSINEIEKARERVKQKELTFKPKEAKKEPKSWETY